MPKKGKPRSRAQVAFMRKALDRGYVPLTPAQVRYFEKVVHQGKHVHGAGAGHHQHRTHGHAYSTSPRGEYVRHVPHVKKARAKARRRAS